jgi:dihydrofolate reductase
MQTLASLFGRATYEHMAAHWPTEKAKANDPAMTARMNNKDKVVFSATLTDVDWSGTTLVHVEATEQIPNVMAGAGQELLVIGSAHLTANLGQAGILDELRIMICPFVLGQGRSLFEDLRNRVSLSLIRVRRFGSGTSYSPTDRRPTRAKRQGEEAARQSAAAAWTLAYPSCVTSRGRQERSICRSPTKSRSAAGHGAWIA